MSRVSSMAPDNKAKRKKNRMTSTVFIHVLTKETTKEIEIGFIRNSEELKGLE